MIATPCYSAEAAYTPRATVVLQNMCQRERIEPSVSMGIGRRRLAGSAKESVLA
jgi:hypothetical protein